jgi:site-specific recombinase XerD
MGQESGKFEICSELSMRDAFSGLADKTIIRYMWHTHQFCSWCEDNRVNPVSPGVRDLVRYLHEKEQWASSMKTVALAALRRWFAFHHTEDDYANPADAQSLRKSGRGGKAFNKKRLPVSLDEMEYQRFIQATCVVSGNTGEHPDTFPVIRKKMIQRLMLWTGLRVSEAISLRTGDIRLEGEHPYLRVIGKGDKEREIPIHDRLTQEMVEYIEARAAFMEGQGGQAANSANSIGGTLFSDRYDAPYTAAGVWSMVSRTLESIDVQKRHRGPHVLRHTFATRQLQSGIAPAVVKAWMGHSDLRVLFSVYEHVIASPKGVRPV